MWVLPVANAQKYNCDGQPSIRYPFICINRQTIQLINVGLNL